MAILIGAVAAPSDPGWTVRNLADLAPEGAGGRWAEVAVHARSLAALRAALPWLELAGRAAIVTLTIGATDRPRGLSAPSLVVQRPVLAASLTRPGDSETGPARLIVRLAKATRVVSVARAALATYPARDLPAAGLRLGVASLDAVAWAAGDPAASVLTPAAEDAEVTPFDAVLGTAPEGPVTSAVPYLRVGAGDLVLPPVDVTVCSPMGFGPAGPATGVLTRASGGWQVQVDGKPVTADLGIGFDGNVDENTVRNLRPLRLVTWDGTPPDRGRSDAPSDQPTSLGRVLAQLCCAGVPVRAAGMPAVVADALGAGLADRLRTMDPALTQDPLHREAWSIATRRMALSRFAAPDYWRARARAHGLAAAPPPLVSVVLPTRRPEFLPFALAQVSRQDWPELELVLVLHGVPSDAPAVRAALTGFTRPFTVVEVGTEIVFGQALNAGLARSSGRLVAKMDDDDWYGPSHLTDLVQAHGHSGATLIGTAGYQVYLESAHTTVRFSRTTEAYTHRVHGGTMLIAAEDLRALGGWRPLRFGEDAEVIRMVQSAGGSIYGIHDLGFTYYRGRDHTWLPAGGDARWLAGDYARAPGFVPPPHLHPLPHPRFAQP